MIRRFKLSSTITVVASALSILWLLGYMVAVLMFQQGSLEFGDLERPLQFWFLFTIVYHVLAGHFLFLHFRHYERFFPLTLITLSAGIVSFIMLAGDWAALHDIGHDLSRGIPYARADLLLLKLAWLPHLVFFILAAVCAARGLRGEERQIAGPKAVMDEIMFQTVHYTGLLCGFFGICFLLVALLYRVPDRYLHLIIAFYGLFILIPYLTAVLYWLLIKRKQKQAGWYDEKQMQDLAKAGLTTLLLSIPVMTVVFILGQVFKSSPLGSLWLPIYIFLLLFSFSATSLYWTHRG